MCGGGCVVVVWLWLDVLVVWLCVCVFCLVCGGLCCAVLFGCLSVWLCVRVCWFVCVCLFVLLDCVCVID